MLFYFINKKNLFSACSTEEIQISCIENGKKVLEQYDFEEDNYIKDLLTMLAMYFVLHIVGYILLTRKFRRWINL